MLTQHAQELSQRQLVLLDANSSQVLKVLSKFEAPEFIHVFMPGRCPGDHLPSSTKPTGASASSRALLLPKTGKGSAGMVWQLPRCRLDFELTAEGRVVSLDHRGYCLSTQQLLVSKSAQGVAYTLPELHQYLVLQAQPSSTSKYVGADQSDQLVLVPAGRVLVQRHAPGSTHTGSSIQVQLNPHCHAPAKVSVAQTVMRHMHKYASAEPSDGCCMVQCVITRHLLMVYVALPLMATVVQPILGLSHSNALDGWCMAAWHCFPSSALPLPSTSSRCCLVWGVTGLALASTYSSIQAHLPVPFLCCHAVRCSSTVCTAASAT